MGQYYKIINVTKKEVMVPWTWDNGAKLMEWAYQGNPMVKAFSYLMSHDWEEDLVLICGDYLEPSSMEQGEVFEEALKKAEDLLGCKDISLYERSLEDDFTEVAPVGATKYSNKNVRFVDFEKEPDFQKGKRYLFNARNGTFVDVSKLPVEFVYWKDKENCIIGKCSISPLVLLLTAGNGRGGGDYYGTFANNKELVGTWCNDSDAIFLHNKKPVGFSNRPYTELVPAFTESGVHLSEKESKEKIQEEIKNLKIRALTQFKSEGYFDSIEGYAEMIPEDFEALADAWCEGQPVMEAVKLFFKEKQEEQER